MARQTIRTVTLVDDLDGGKATRTLRFSVDGELYEIDLSYRNVRRMERALTPYMKAGRKVVQPRAKRRRKP